MQPPALYAKPTLGISARGDIAEVWRGEQHLGFVYQWFIQGNAARWEGDALKYRIENAGGGEVEFRFVLSTPGGMFVYLQARGHIASTVVEDGTLQKQAVRLKGTRLEVA